jgi:molecular chaperone GrpE
MSHIETNPPVEGVDPVTSASSEPVTEPSAETRLAELEARHAEMADAYLRAKAEA